MPLLVVAVVPEVKLMAVMRVAEMPAAGMTAGETATMAATMAAAGGYVTRGRKRGGSQRYGGNGNKEWSRGFHGGAGAKRSANEGSV